MAVMAHGDMAGMSESSRIPHVILWMDQRISIII